jgi:cell division protein ZapA
MESIEITIGGQKYVLRGEDSQEHLREVAEMVRRKVESLRKKTSGLTLQKAAMLAAFDFASESIKGKKRAVDYRSQLLTKAHQLLERVQSELSSKLNVQ